MTQPPPPQPKTTPVSDPSGEAVVPAEQPRLLDRDLQWLEFNRRVLNEALDPRTPLLERLSFLGIFTTNLDEFFMKRIGALYPRATRSSAHSSADRALALAIRDTLRPMLEDQARCLDDEVRPQLAARGIQLLGWEELGEDECAAMQRYFQANVYPVLTPQAVDTGHPFPFISNLSTSLAVALTYPGSEERIFARVKLPPSIPAWIELPTSSMATRRFVSLRAVVRHNLSELFPGMEVRETMLFRVTRNADVRSESIVARDLLETVAEEVRRRRLQQGVRLEHRRGADPWLLLQVVEAMGFLPEQIYELPRDLDMAEYRNICKISDKELHYEPWTPVVPPALGKKVTDLFSAIRAGDILAHHPYEDFEASVARFIRTATQDKDVLAIKMTLYRAGDESPFIPLMIEAAEAGKQVACLIELKARFDEHRNIRWAQALEDAGVHVIYGIIGVKTHAKTAIVVRREPDGLRRYAHIGTGNYNPQTARLYTDLSLLTCNPEITAEVGEVFNHLTGRSIRHDFQHLLVAPINMKARLLAMIRREAEHRAAGRPARIVAKCNQLEDPEICAALYEAAAVGLQIDLIVRGFCLLRPGVPGLSESIRVVSVIGRFLE
ncbi:MAG: polyphosphate kinase 1, partial [Planctomycetes bacterium]|nr:polyphosphate kinase 1 [Planctomycetota bacterium]